MDAFEVTANGLTFACRRAGDGDRLALCLHGFPDDAGSMDGIARRLADAGYTAVAPYMRGYAPTDAAPDGDYSVPALGEDAVALAGALGDRFGTDDAVLVGHDWGAAAGYAAARTDPDAFTWLATLAVPPGFEALLVEHPRQVLRSWYMWFFQLPAVPERALRARDYALVEFLWATWSPGWAYPSDRIESVKATLDRGDTTANAIQYYRDTVGPAVGQLLRGDVTAPEEVPPLVVPTLVLAGDRDGCIGPALFAAADHFIDAPCRVVRVREAGHFLHLERPDVVGEEILAWL